LRCDYARVVRAHDACADQANADCQLSFPHAEWP
jgi:hypothetical protein